MLCEYEQQREARIAYNRQRLKDLGIEDEVEALRQHAAKRPRAAPRRPPTEEPAIRQSQRIRKAGVDQEDKENVQSEPPRRAVPPRPAAASLCTDGAEYDELSSFRCACLLLSQQCAWLSHRLRTMSEQALLRRLRRSILPKLRSFARVRTRNVNSTPARTTWQVCEQEGHTELAEVARQRLAQLGSG